MFAREWFRGFVRKHAGRPLGRWALRDLAPLNQLLARDQTYRQIEISVTSEGREDDGEGLRASRWQAKRRWQIATVANRRGDGRPHLPKGLHLRAQVRRSNLHSVVPRRQQGPWSALVQHGSVRQSGEGCGASYPRAGVPRTSLIDRSPIRDLLAPLYQKACA